MTSVEDWSIYWQTGIEHSCPGSFDSTYGGVIERFWAAVCRQMQPGDRVIDIATGNGALAGLLLKRCPSLHIDGIDSAQLSPPSDLSRLVQFHSRVDVAKLPFGSNSANWIVSQFGFEYGERDAAFSECSRVLKAGGKWAMVLHHADSVIARASKREVESADLLLAPDGLIAAAMDVLPYLAARRSGLEPHDPQRAEASRLDYNTATRSLLGRRSEPLLNEALQFTHKLVCAVDGQSLQRHIASLLSYAKHIEAGRNRCRAMLAAALTRSDAAMLAARIGDATAIYELRQTQGLIGWGLISQPLSPAEEAALMPAN